MNHPNGMNNNTYNSQSAIQPTAGVTLDPSHPQYKQYLEHYQYQLHLQSQALAHAHAQAQVPAHVQPHFTPPGGIPYANGQVGFNYDGLNSFFIEICVSL